MGHSAFSLLGIESFWCLRISNVIVDEVRMAAGSSLEFFPGSSSALLHHQRLIQLSLC